MYKIKIIILVLLIAILVSGRAYCQDRFEDQQMSTITGKVVKAVC